MGKLLIIKGADFSANALEKDESVVNDITRIMFEHIYQGGINAYGQYDDSTNRVSGDIVSIDSLGLTFGDRISVITPSGDYCLGIRHGSSATNLPNNSFWYGSYWHSSDLTKYRGETFTIPDNSIYISFTFGKHSSGDLFKKDIDVAEVDELINNHLFRLEII